jgi:hypothetical protein
MPLMIAVAAAAPSAAQPATYDVNSLLAIVGLSRPWHDAKIYVADERLRKVIGSRFEMEVELVDVVFDPSTESFKFIGRAEPKETGITASARVVCMFPLSAAPQLTKVFQGNTVRVSGTIKIAAVSRGEDRKDGELIVNLESCAVSRIDK